MFYCSEKVLERVEALTESSLCITSARCSCLGLSVRKSETQQKRENRSFSAWEYDALHQTACNCLDMIFDMFGSFEWDLYVEGCIFGFWRACFGQKSSSFTTYFHHIFSILMRHMHSNMHDRPSNCVLLLWEGIKTCWSTYWVVSVHKFGQM